MDLEIKTHLYSLIGSLNESTVSRIPRRYLAYSKVYLKRKSFVGSQAN